MRLAASGAPVAVKKSTKLRTSLYNLYTLKYVYITLSYLDNISNYYVTTGQVVDWRQKNYGIRSHGYFLYHSKAEFEFFTVVGMNRSIFGGRNIV
jgi:hypothetical protein